MTRGPLGSALAILFVLPSLSEGQVVVQGGVQTGRAEHRVITSNALVPASGTLLGAALTVGLGERFEIQGQALGGHLAAPSTPGFDDHDVAQAQILGGMKVQPWVTVQTGFVVRNFSNSLARQHWTSWLIGAETHVPLGFDQVTADLRGYWMPVVAVSDLASPDVALSAGIGVGWRGRRLAVSALYTFERYDFPPSNGTRRLEELATLRLLVSMWWPRR